MSDLGWNIWGAVAAVLGLAIPSCIAWFFASLPTYKLPPLVALMAETEKLFNDALRDGLLTDESDIYDFQINILAASIRVLEVSTKVYTTQSTKQNIRNWCNGLSKKISLISVDLNLTRVKLLERSSQERKKLISQGLSANIPSRAGEKGAPLPLFPCMPAPLYQDSAPPQGAYFRHVGYTAAPACPSSMRGLFEEEDIVDAAIGDSSHIPSVFARSFHDILGYGRASHPLRTPLPFVPAHHCACDRDLQGLLSLALSHPVWRSLPPDTLYGDPVRLHQYPRRDAWLEPLGRSLRRTYGVDPSVLGTNTKTDLDPESLLPRSGGYSEFGGSEGYRDV